MSATAEVLSSVANPWADATGHRPKNQKKQAFGVTLPDTGVHVVCNHTFIEKGGMSPRHHHNFEQIRYVLEGHLFYGRKTIGPGTLMYVPESVDYGPQTRDEDTRAVVFQFSGPSGIPKFSQVDSKAARQKLLSEGVTFQKGIAHFPSGKKQDAAEALWEFMAGRPIEYPPPRYEDPIYIYTQAFVWQPTKYTGVAIKRLGYFNECGPNVSLLRMEPKTSLPRNGTHWLDIRVVLEGEVDYAGQNCAAVSRIYCPPGGEYDEMGSASGATVLVFQIATPGGAAPAREWI